MTVLDTFRNPPAEIDPLIVSALPGTNVPPGSMQTGGSNYCANSPDVYGNNAYFNCLDVINLHVWNSSGPPWAAMTNGTALTTNGGSVVNSASTWLKPANSYWNTTQLVIIPAGMQFPFNVRGPAVIDIQWSVNLAQVTGATVGQVIAVGLQVGSLFNTNPDYGMTMLLPYYANTGFTQIRATFTVDVNVTFSPTTWNGPGYYILGPAGVNFTIANQVIRLAMISTF